MGEPWSELDSHNVLSICTITNIRFYSCNPYSLNYFRKAHVCNFLNKQSCHWVNSWAFCTTNLRELWTGIDSKNKESHGIFIEQSDHNRWGFGQWHHGYYFDKLIAKGNSQHCSTTFENSSSLKQYIKHRKDSGIQTLMKEVQWNFFTSFEVFR